MGEGSGQRTTGDEIIVVEVLAEQLDPSWWSDYRRKLEKRFRQEDILIRSHGVMKL